LAGGRPPASPTGEIPRIPQDDNLRGGCRSIRGVADESTRAPRQITTRTKSRERGNAIRKGRPPPTVSLISCLIFWFFWIKPKEQIDREARERMASAVPRKAPCRLEDSGDLLDLGQTTATLRWPRRHRSQAHDPSSQRQNSQDNHPKRSQLTTDNSQPTTHPPFPVLPNNSRPASRQRVR
jgi:hypothetical protein